MKSRKISYLKIKNFKIFNDIEVKDLKRINLIGGKNNIGKTAFLEAVYLNTTAIDFNMFLLNIKNIMRQRHNSLAIDIFSYGSNHIHINSDFKNIGLEYNNSLPEPIVFLEIDKEKQGVPVSTIINGSYIVSQHKIHKVTYVHSGYIDAQQLAELYASIINAGKESLIDRSLKIFDDNMLSLRQVLQNGQIIFKVLMKNIETPVLLSSFGEGMNRFVAILCAIWASQDGVLLIDEIENGIHYTNYVKLWELIFEVSKEANCQIFATTHSKECIEAFNSINTENEGAYLEFYKNSKRGNIVVKNRDHELLQYSLSHKGRFRGE